MPKMTNGRVVPETGNIIFVNNQDNNSSANGGITEYESNPVQYLIDVYGENSGSTGAGVYIETTKNDNVRVLKFKNIAVDESLYLFDNGNTLSIGISPDSGLPIGNNVLSVRKGGTGASSLPFNCLLVGNGINAVKAVPLPTGNDQFLTFENNNYVWKTASSGANNTVDIKSSSDIITITITGTESNKTFTLNVDQTKIKINEINGILSTTKGGTGLSFVGANNEVLVSNGSSLEYKTISAGMITGLSTVATSGSYNDLVDKPIISDGTVKSVGIVTNHDALVSSGGPITTSGNITLSLDETKLDASKMLGVIDVEHGGTGVSAISKDNIVIGLDSNKTGVIIPPTNDDSFLTYEASGYVWKTLDEVIPTIGTTYSVISADEMTNITTSITGNTETFEIGVSPENIPINQLDGVLSIENGGTGLTAVGADNQFLISRNGEFVYSFIDSSMVSGLATVATSGDYNDLKNKPVGGSVTSVGLISSNASLIVGNSPITSFGDLTIDFDSSKVRLQDLGGLLSVTKGGTGRNTLFKNRIIIGNDDQAVGSIELPDEDNKFLSFSGTSYTWKKIEPSKYSETIVTSSGNYITVNSNTGIDTDTGGSTITYDVIFNPTSVSLNEFSGILNTTLGGTGLGAIGAAGTILQSNGTGLMYGKVATSSITGLANVAISGDYNDLINKPEGNGSVTSVGLKSLSDAITVANTPITTSGDIIVSFDPSKVTINDISGILSVSKGGTGLTSIGANGSFLKSSNGSLEYANIVPDDITGLSDVATSGDYNDLINKPVTTGTVTSIDVSTTGALKSSGGPITTSGSISLSIAEDELNIENMNGVLPVSKGGTGNSSTVSNGILVGGRDNIDFIGTPDNGQFLTFDNGLFSWMDLTDIGDVGSVTTISSSDPDNKIIKVTDSGFGKDYNYTLEFIPGDVSVDDFSGILSVEKGGTGVSALSNNQIMLGGDSIVGFVPAPEANKFLGFNGTDYVWSDVTVPETTDTVTTIVSGHESNSVIKVTDDGPIGTYQYTLKFIPGDVHIGDFSGFLEVVKGGIGMTSVPKNAVLLGNGQQRMETVQPLSNKKSVLTHTLNNEVIWEEVTESGSNISIEGAGIISVSTENDIATISLAEPTDKTFTSFLTFDDNNKAVWTKLENNTRTNISSLSSAIDVDQIAGQGFVNNRLTFIPSEVDIADLSGVLPVTKGGTGVSEMPDISGAVLGFDGENVRFMTLTTGSITDLADVASTGSFTDLTNVPEFVNRVYAGSNKITATTVDNDVTIDINTNNIELQTLSGMLPVSKGGTGLNEVGTENQVLAVKDGSLQYVTPTTTLLGLSRVAESGSFDDLSDVPSIVSNIRSGYGTTTRIDTTNAPSHPNVDDMAVDIVPSQIGINEFKDTVSVQKGGTGLSTLTNNSVMVGNGTDAVKLVTPSTDIKQKLIHDTDNKVKWANDISVDTVIFDSVLSMQGSSNLGNNFVGNDTLKTLEVFDKQGEKKYDVLTDSFSTKLESEDGQNMIGIKNPLGTKELFLKDIVVPESTMGSYSEAIMNEVFNVGNNGVFEVQNPFDVNKFHSGKVKLSNRETVIDTIGLHDVIKSVDVKKPKTILLPTDAYEKISFASNNGYIISTKDANKEFSAETTIVTYGIDGEYKEKYHDFSVNKITDGENTINNVYGISDITYISNPILPSPVYFARVIDDSSSNNSFYAVISETGIDNDGPFTAFASSAMYAGFTTKMVNKVFNNSGLDPEIRTYVCSKNNINSNINLSSFNFTMNDVLISPDGSYDKALPKDVHMIDNNILLNDKSPVGIPYDLVMFGEYPAIVYIDKTEDFAVDQNRSGDNRFANSYTVGMRIYNDNTMFQNYFRHSTVELVIFRNVPSSFIPIRVCVPYNISFGEFFPVFVLDNNNKLYMQVCSIEAVTSKLKEFEYQVSPGETIKNLFLTRKNGGYKLSLEIETSEGMTIKTMYFTEEYILNGMHSVNKSISNLHLFDKRIDRATNDVVVSTLNHIGDMAVDFNTATPSASGVYSMAFDILKPVTQLNSFTVAIQCQPNTRFRMSLVRSTGFYTETQYKINSEIVNVSASGFIQFNMEGFGGASFNLATGNYILILYACDASGNLVQNNNFRIGRVVNTANRAIMLNDAIMFRGSTTANIVTTNGSVDIGASTIAPLEGTGYKTHNIAAISFNGKFGFSEYVAGD